MTLNERLLAEMKQEAASTRRILERVPMDKSDYKPHEKSMSLGHLATHVAEIAGWWNVCLVQNELDFAAGDFKPKELTSTEQLLALHDEHVQQAEKILQDISESEFENMWTMRQGEMIFFTLPKSEVVRTWCLNHLYHHRAQLGVYLRLLNIPVPGIYGPSADEN